MSKILIWPEGANVRQKPIRGGAMLYDASRAGNAEASWFDPIWWSGRGSVREGEEGRGSTLFIEADGRDLVLRQYRRGGFAARLSRNRYLWQGGSRTRSFSEWHLLYLMRHAGLPVPTPIAACYRRTGRYLYTAQILTELIPNVTSLAARLISAPVPFMMWVETGRALRRFHAEGVFHADLNAHNVLLNDGPEVWLVDFDRGALRKPGLWCDANLVRLRRSIDKITATLPPERFSDADWASLLSGYFAGLAQPAPELTVA
ncbi:MAG TPA: 3-deoxy-D-manno-octulosonic acid kinase [Steroidobacteraceae bacterium]|nr:3-deoxy-D-manno-octulosonic acid kinase [Steroidobacteraceae bacterium]